MNESRIAYKVLQSALIFVVNDSPTQLAYLSDLLKKEGLDTQSFNSAEAALEALKSGATPDLIITDLNMPDIDGWVFCRLLRSPEYNAFNSTPILVVSATFAGKDPEQITTDLGANVFLPAPVEQKLFMEHVKRLIAGETPQRIPHVLVIENDTSVASLLTKTFITHGYQVDTACTGHDALQLFHEGHPEIVVLDYHLPDTEGDRLIKEFSRNDPSCAVIVITSDPKPGLALQVMKLGARAYVREPFDPEYLLTLCENARRESVLLHVEALLEDRTRKLNESKEKYRSILESIEEGYYEVDLFGNFIFANESLCRITHVPMKELVGSKSYRFTDEESAKAIFAIYHGVFKTGKDIDSLDFQFIRNDGQRCYVNLSVSRILSSNGECTGFRGIIKDVTNRVIAELALKESERRYRMLAENMHDTVWTIDLELRLTYVSPSIVRLTGFTPEEIQNMGIEQLLTPPSYALAKQVLSEELINEQRDKSLDPGRSRTIEIEQLHKDGNKAWIEFTATFIRDDKGKPLAILGVSRDITERKQAAIERERLVTDLKLALADIKTLRGFLPICASCKKIRDDKGYWNQIESYISEHSDAVFSHGLCPECAEKFYPDFLRRNNKR